MSALINANGNDINHVDNSWITEQGLDEGSDPHLGINCIY